MMLGRIVALQPVFNAMYYLCATDIGMVPRYYYKTGLTFRKQIYKDMSVSGALSVSILLCGYWFIGEFSSTNQFHYSHYVGIFFATIEGLIFLPRIHL